MSHIINNNLSSPRTENKKRSTGALISRSKPVGTLNSARRTASIPPSKCSLCEKKSYKHSHNLITITHKTLYTKYASSQNYYYTKDINELLSDSHTPTVILHKDLQTFDENEEYLKRIYRSSEYNGKIKLLAEYYKFHWDIPRLFMMPITEVVNRYHDRKRRLQYLKVTKMLKDQKDSKNPTIKRETEHKPKVEEQKPMSIADKLLVGLETSHSIIKQEAQRQQEGNTGARTLTGQGGETQRRGHQVREGGLREQRQKKEEDDAHRTTFNTLHDLNLKLGEIVSNSQVRLADTNYFDNGDQSLNESLSNLKNFLNYLQTNTGSTNIVPQPMSEITKIAQQTETQQARPVLAEAPVKRTAIVKSITPRLEKPREEDAEQQQGLRSTRGPVIGWNRADSTPMITPSPLELARRGSAETKEAARVEEKAKEAGHGGLGHMSSVQSSLSSTMTSKSKSVYSSVTKIRNFEEAVKISQQGSQIKLVSPVDAASNKYANKPVLLRVNPSGSGSQQEMGQREASPSTEFIYKGMDSSIKTPIGFSEDKSKESSNKEALSPVSKHSSQVFSTSGSKPGTRLMTAKNMTISSTRTMEGFMPRSPEMISPTNQSPNFRIKSHREAGTSFDRNAQNVQLHTQNMQTVQNVQTNIQSPGKQVPQIQMPSGRTHARFGSGTFASPTGKSTAAKVGTPTLAVQTGRELKNLIALGALDVPIKEMKTIPNSASRKSDSKAEGGVAYSVKGSDGSATDREREVPPLSPKMSATPRGKLISHKHTRSEGGKLFKLDQMEMPMGSLNEQRIKELMRLSDVGPDAFSDCSQKLKKGEGLAKKMSSYNGSNNIANLVMSSNREMHYESVPTAPGSKKHQTNKASGEFMMSGASNGALISNRSTKPDVIVRKKSQLKKGEVASGDVKQKKPPSPGLVLDKFDEPKLGKPKALTVKGSGSFTPSNFSKGTVQPKARGKQEFF